MGVREFVDGVSDLVKIMQLRNYFSNKEDISNKNIVTKNLKLRQSILKDKLKIIKDYENEYLVDGEDILKVKKELKEIGAKWNEVKKSVVLTRNSLTNNLDKEVITKIDNEIKKMQKEYVNKISEKIVNKELVMSLQEDKYKVVGYTREIQDILKNLGFSKINDNFYIDKTKFKMIFPENITKLVEINNNEYSVKSVDKLNEKIKINAIIVDTKNKTNNKEIELPITLVNFSKLKKELGTNNLKITKINSNDQDITDIFKGKSNVADINTIHKFNVLARRINEFNKENLQEYKEILKNEGLKNINEYVQCATQLREEIIER